MYADVALPVPLDHPFTYLLPETLRHRVRTGCRLIVPFGSRKLTGVVVNTHEIQPSGPVKEAFRLLDEEPVLEDHLISLGRWIASYYCAPIGEVLRVMTPLGGEMRSTKMYSLTDAGRDAARQLLFGADSEDPTIQVLRLLERRSLSAIYLAKKVADAPKALRSLLKKAFVELDDVQVDRDPLRSGSARLRVHSPGWWPESKLKKAERELLSYLELHPGSHNLAEVCEAVKGASEAARALARRKILTLEVEGARDCRPSLQTATYAESSSGSGVRGDPHSSGVQSLSFILAAKASPAPGRQEGVSPVPSKRRSRHKAAMRCSWYPRLP